MRPRASIPFRCLKRLAARHTGQSLQEAQAEVETSKAVKAQRPSLSWRDSSWVAPDARPRTRRAIERRDVLTERFRALRSQAPG
jgi:hypothetical protein